MAALKGEHIGPSSLDCEYRRMTVEQEPELEVSQH